MPRVLSSVPPPASLVFGHERRITLGAEIGRGSLARVHRAVVETPSRLRQVVAAKVFVARAGTDDDDEDAVVAAIGKATRNAALVQHPNVVRVFDFAFLPDGRPCALLELVEGSSLRKLIDAYAADHRRLPPDLALFIALEVAEGLTGAYEARTDEGVRMHLAHHALSPREVLLSLHGEVKVSDFGLAGAVRPSSEVRVTRSMAHRVATWAPEVGAGGRGDARSDVFALGMMLREMLVGPRFPAGTTDAQACTWVNDGYVHHGVFDPRLPPPVDAIVRRAVEVDPTKRYAHASAMAFDLRRALLAMAGGDGRMFLRGALEEKLSAARFGSADATQPARAFSASSKEVAPAPADEDTARDLPEVAVVRESGPVPAGGGSPRLLIDACYFEYDDERGSSPDEVMALRLKKKA